MTVAEIPPIATLIVHRPSAAMVIGMPTPEKSAMRATPMTWAGVTANASGKPIPFGVRRSELMGNAKTVF